MNEPRTPAQVWREMVRGNERFITGAPRHPRQDVDRRTELAHTQAPHAVIFGCSDSRLAAEIIFDKGLGDLFVVRNAGQVVSDSVLGSVEYAVAVLDVPLVLVLGHDECGAVRAAIDATQPDAAPLPPHIADLIQPIIPVARRVPSGPEGKDASEVGRQHLRGTVSELVQQSELISAGIAAGTLAIVGANYRLQEGRVAPDIVVGDVDDERISTKGM